MSNLHTPATDDDIHILGDTDVRRFSETIENSNLRRTFLARIERIERNENGNFTLTNFGKAFEGSRSPRLKAIAMSFVDTVRDSLGGTLTDIAPEREELDSDDDTLAPDVEVTDTEDDLSDPEDDASDAEIKALNFDAS